MSISRGPGTGTGTAQACAACKYQRRKCAPDCILAPFFPHDRQRQFLNAHKLFGVSNITKIIKNLDPPDKEEAMKNIIFQSDVRANDPVGGCYRIICDLQRQIEYNKAELDLVLNQLALCRSQAQIQMPESSNSEIGDVDSLMNTYNPMQFNNYLQAQQEQYFLQNNHNAWGMENCMQALTLHDDHNKQSFVNESNDVKPVMETPCERSKLKFEGQEASFVSTLTSS